jgi:hypothetical protein
MTAYTTASELVDRDGSIQPRGATEIEHTDEHEVTDLINRIVWADIEIGSLYLRLLATKELTNPYGHQHRESMPFYIPDDELQSAKDEADYLIDMCKSLNYKIEIRKLCKDGIERTIRRWPTYGDIVTLPRDWVIEHLARDSEPEEERPDQGLAPLNHVYDDSWWSDERPNTFNLEPDPKSEKLTFKDVWEDQAYEIARRVDAGEAKTKTRATFDILEEHGNCYFTKEFKSYVRRKFEKMAQQRVPNNTALIQMCYAEISEILASSYNLHTWRNLKFRNYYQWALDQLVSFKQFSRIEELDQTLNIKLPTHRRDKCYTSSISMLPDTIVPREGV